MKKRAFLKQLLGSGMMMNAPFSFAKNKLLVQLIVPFAPGGLADILARLLATAVQKRGQYNMVVVNRPGATGMVALNALMRTRPDEMALMLTSTGQLIQSLISGKQKDSHNILANLRYGYLLGHQDGFMVVPEQLKIHTLSDFELTFKNKSVLPNLGTLGIGSVGHLQGVTLASALNLLPIHVPYNSSTGIVQGFLSGDIHYAFMAFENFKTQMNANLIVPVAVAASKTSPLLPHVPTFNSLGVKSVNRGTWFALAYGKHMQSDLVGEFYENFKDIFLEEDVLTDIRNMGISPDFKKKETLDQFITSEIAYWKARLTGIV